MTISIPPGAARPHLHEHHETAIYVLQGRSEVRCGEGLREHLEVRAGRMPNPTRLNEHRRPDGVREGALRDRGVAHLVATIRGLADPQVEPVHDEQWAERSRDRGAVSRAK